MIQGCRPVTAANAPADIVDAVMDDYTVIKDKKDQAQKGQKKRGRPKKVVKDVFFSDQNPKKEDSEDQK